jgi:hypothetical protein
MPLLQRPQIRERGQTQEDEERFTSKDLTRKQIFLYIFEDFFKGFFIFLSLFLDGVVVFYLYQEPFIQNITPDVIVSGVPIYTLYVILFSIFIDAFLIYYEIKLYFKLFGEEAIKKRYQKKSDVEREKLEQQKKEKN